MQQQVSSGIAYYERELDNVIDTVAASLQSRS